MSKRKREITTSNLPPEPNYFFMLIIIDSNLLHVIFSNLNLVDLLTIYRVLYFHLIKFEGILNSMEKYLKDENSGLVRGFSAINKYVFNKKMKKYKGLHYEPEDYLKKLTKFNKFRYTRNFVKYGLCACCNNLPNTINSIDCVSNFNCLELESRYLYTCDRTYHNTWMTRKELIKEIDIDEYVLAHYARYRGIRYKGNPQGEKLYYANDVKDLQKRKVMLKKYCLSTIDKSGIDGFLNKLINL